MKLTARPSPKAAAPLARTLDAFGRRFHRVLALAALVLTAPIAGAQQTGTTVTGVIKDVLTGEPIQGVNVSVRGTPRAASTNAEGRYTITGLSAGTYAIEARRITYQMAQQADVRVTGTGTVTVNLNMSQATLMLDAVTSAATVDPVSGKKATFAVATLTAEAFPVPTTGAAAALQNKVPGVSVTRGSGDPNDEPWVQLRSMSSPFKDNGPLWVIDGIPLNTTAQGSIGSVRTQDIESLDIANIEVIKGAAAAAQYGSAAAGGVIVITTNRGKDVSLGKAEITVRTDMGYDAVPDLPEKRQHHYYMQNSKGQWINASGVVVPRNDRVIDTDRMLDNPYVRTYDNINQILKANTAMTNTVTLRQNSAATNYSLSYNRTNNPGIVRFVNGQLNQNIRFNVQHQFRDNLEFDLGLNHARQLAKPTATSFSQLFSWDPDVNLSRPGFDTRWEPRPDSGSTSTNPLYTDLIRDRQTRNASTDFNASTNFRPLTWLTLSGQLGYRRGDNIQDYFTPPGVPDTDGLGFTDGDLSYREVETNILSARSTLAVLRDIGQLTARVSVGAETQRDQNLLFSATGSDFTTTGIKDLAGATNKDNSSTISESRVNSFVSGAALDYGGRYAFQGNFRHEGNSLFGPKNRWNDFFGVGGSWIMSSEPWYPSFMSNFTLAKLRYNYGTAGTKPGFTDQYENISLLGGGLFLLDRLGNSTLAPEMKYDHEAGIDLIWKNRLSATYTFVKTRTRGAIVEVEAPASTGFNTFTDNAGGTSGYTHEFNVEGQILQRPKGLRWTTSFQMSRSAMDVDFYGRSCYKETPAILYRCPGIPVTSYWGGYFMTSHDQLAESRSATPGAWQVDNNGFLVPVGEGNNWWEGKSKALWGTVITIDGTAYNWGVPQLAWDDSAGESVYQKIGDWQPLFEYGWTNRFNRGNLGFNLLFGGQVGGDIYNRSTRDLYSSLDHPDVTQAGVPDSLQKSYFYYAGGGTGSLATGTYNSYFVHKNASYLKLREAAISYSFARAQVPLLSKMGAERMNVQILGRDLWRFMPGYKGIDPEGFLNLNGGIRTRVDGLRYPPGRRLTGSLSIVF